jgi:hypothetical protein
LEFIKLNPKAVLLDSDIYCASGSEKATYLINEAIYIKQEAIYLTHEAIYLIHKAICLNHEANYLIHEAIYLMHEANYLKHEAYYVIHKASYLIHEAIYLIHEANYLNHEAYYLIHETNKNDFFKANQRFQHKRYTFSVNLIGEVRQMFKKIFFSSGRLKYTHCKAVPAQSQI